MILSIHIFLRYVYCLTDKLMSLLINHIHCSGVGRGAVKSRIKGDFTALIRKKLKPNINPNSTHIISSIYFVDFYLKYVTISTHQSYKYNVKN